MTTHPPRQLGVLCGGGGGVRAVSGLLDHEAGPGQPQQLGAGVTGREARGLGNLDPVLGLTAGLAAAAREAAEADRHVPLGPQGRRRGCAANTNLTGADVTSLC